MRLITSEDKAHRVARRWKEAYYYNDNKWMVANDGTSFHPKTIYNKLMALGENPNPKDVDACIGNSSWTETICSECKKYTDRAVKIDSYDEEVYLCLDCLGSAQKLCQE